MQLLFIYPHTNYFTNPTIDYILKELGKIQNVSLTLVIPEQTEPLPTESVNLVRRSFNFRTSWPKKIWKWPPILSQYLRLIRYTQNNKIDKIIAIDPEGIIVAGRIKKYLTNVELHYFPFEIFFKHEIKKNSSYFKLKCMESFYIKKVDVVVIQDIVRKELFFLENELIDEHLKVYYIPVAPVRCVPPQYSRQKFRKKLGIKEDEIVLLHSGSVAKWSGAVNIIELLKLGLPQKYKIVIHSKHKLSYDNEWHVELLRLQNEGYPVVLHDEVFPEYDDYLNFVNCADYGIAFYTTDTSSPYTGKNIEEIGLASGKFACYASQGIPVIVTNAKIYQILNEKYSFGLVVHNMSELNHLLHKESRPRFDARNIFELYNSELDPEKFGKKYIKELVS